MANIRDVAKKAGVGIGTVSRALNNSGYVSKETLNKIISAAEEIGYEHNITFTQPPKKERSGLVGIMLPTISHPFYSRMLRYIEFELSQYGLRCMACNTMDIFNRSQEFVKLLDDHYMDGLIALTPPPDGFMGRRGRPIISVDRWWGDDVPMIRSDHERGGQIAAEALLRSGCKKVIQLCGRGRNSTPNIRHLIFEQILEKKGCEVTTVELPRNHINLLFNRAIISEYWPIISTMDACFGNDLLAMCCLVIAAENGVKVPEQLKVIGYDGTDITALSHPLLSVVEQDCPALAKACVDTLVPMIEGETPRDMITKVPVIWQERGTT